MSAIHNSCSAAILRNSARPALVSRADAARSCLGLGPQAPQPSWGQDSSDSERYLANMKWWMSAGPGIAIFIAVCTVNFLGDARRDALDPRLRRSG